MIQALSLSNPVNGHGRHVIYNAPSGAKAAMVIIHGFGEHVGRYHHMMDYLAGYNIATLAIDLEGHGKSEAQRGVCKSYEILHADVTLGLSEAARLFGDVPIFLHGHSMGGGLVLNHGLTRAPNVAAYIVTAPLIYPAKPVPKTLQAAAKILRKITPHLTLDNAIGGEQVSSLPDIQKSYAGDPLNHSRLGVGLAVDIIEGGAWVADNAENWTAPLLLMHSHDDKLTQYLASEDFAAKAQNCQFLPFKDCEHEIHNDVTRDQVYGAISGFINSNIS